MKKLIWGFLSLLLPLNLSAENYDDSHPFNGIWQFIQTERSTGNWQHLPIWKVMETDYTFHTFILANADGQSVITNNGTYNVVSDSVFVEHITGSITDKNLIGKDNCIRYQFEGTDTLHITYRLPGATADGKESWVRLKLEYPQ